MKIKLISCILWMLLFISTLCFAQLERFGEPPEAISTFVGAQFYSRTLKNKENKETVQQWVFPILATGTLTEDFRIRVYQAISTAKLEEDEEAGLKPALTLSGLENTRIRSSLSLFENTVITYLGFSLPIVGIVPKRETVHFNNLLYSEALQFGVNRITEGFDFDIGCAFAQPFGKLSLSFGAGYVLRGSYDRFSTEGNLVSYNPGDTLNITTGLHFRNGLASLQGRVLYIHYWDDTIDKENTFKSGDEFSFLASATFRFEPLSFTLFLVDTIKGESSSPQEEISINNLFSNRLNGGVSLTYPLLSDTFILKTEARMKSFFDDGVNAKVASFDGGFQLILLNNLTLDVLASFINGDMDAGETEISGFSLGLIGNYGF